VIDTASTHFEWVRLLKFVMRWLHVYSGVMTCFLPVCRCVGMFCVFVNVLLQCNLTLFQDEFAENFEFTSCARTSLYFPKNR